MIDHNIKLSDDEFNFVKSLEKFDMIMFLSEINDHGFERARTLIPIMKGEFKLILNEENRGK
ncbi:MAG: hypothetical protein GOV02_01705 [Candidatus Aenigmarchaeota archaeon]|nr:hypothetical protein [Candidatus Aenigmarchaeota archaeon]